MKVLYPIKILTLAVGLLIQPGVSVADHDVRAWVKERCAKCHGQDGLSEKTVIPRLAGMSLNYLEESLLAFKDKKRACRKVAPPKGDQSKKTSMCEIASKLSKHERFQAAKYFASLTRRSAPQQYSRSLATKGKAVHEKLCDKCHQRSGADPYDDSGVLAGQWMDYLTIAFDDYDKRRRPMGKKMKRKYRMLTKKDKIALVHFYASVGNPVAGK